MEEQNNKYIEEMKQDVKQMVKCCNEPVAQMELVDNLQRLGVSYHFEKDIKVVLDSIFSDSNQLHDDLHVAALRFRLLREHGYHVSPDVFEVFMDEKGRFKNTLAEDVKGLLSLYEASHLGFEGETILEEAKTFATHHLEESTKMPNIDCILARQVAHGLIFYRWWRNLGLAVNLKFCRDRLMENYLWTVGTTFNPLFSACRKGVAKVCCILATIDDIYDVYGTIDELELFTEAVDKWDVAYIDKLPPYMRLCFLALYNTINQFAYDFMRDKGLNIIRYLTRVWGDVCKAYLVEARWFYNGHTPKLEEYLDNAWVSAAGPVILVHVYFLVQHDIKEEAAMDIDRYFDLMKKSSMIARLHNDLVTYKDEIERGDVPKAIECYMKEKHVFEEAARHHIDGILRSAWKGLHQACVEATSNSSHQPIVHCALNFARTAQFVYQHGDGYGFAERDFPVECITRLIAESV